MRMYLEGGPRSLLGLLNGEDPPCDRERSGWNIFWVAESVDNVESLLEEQVSFESLVQSRERSCRVSRVIA
jgi:hypothetical protein